MKVILKEDMDNLGESGTVVDVKPGYARNYLIPQGLAYEASEANIRKLEEERKRAEEEARRAYLEGRRRAAQIEGRTLTFHALASEEGTLFGSITSADVADRLNQEGLDFEVDKRAVEMESPFKEIGSYRVPVKLHADVEAEVDVRVEREEE